MSFNLRNKTINDFQDINNSSKLVIETTVEGILQALDLGENRFTIYPYKEKKGIDIKFDMTNEALITKIVSALGKKVKILGIAKYKQKNNVYPDTISLENIDNIRIFNNSTSNTFKDIIGSLKDLSDTELNSAEMIRITRKEWN